MYTLLASTRISRTGWLTFAAVGLLAAALLLAVGCQPAPGPSGPPDPSGSTAEPEQPGPSGNGNGNTTARGGRSLLYLLQPENVTLDDLIAQPFAWLVIEPSRTGRAADEFPAVDIAALRTGGPCGGKIVLAYLSVGEAEDYRDYWQGEWVSGGRGSPPVPGVAPSWLGPSNPDFPGNYKVRYWESGWQSIILGTATGPDRTPLDRIIDAGFDGVYLDIIDAFDYWSTGDGGNELTRADARSRMIDWIRTIADYARTTRGASGFLVFPQNASDIIRNDDGELDARSEAYFDAISGIGIEDLFYDETQRQPDDETDYILTQLRVFRERGKTVLVTDYVVGGAMTPSTSGSRVADFYARTQAEGLIPYAALEDRGLGSIVVLSPDQWPVSQPPADCGE